MTNDAAASCCGQPASFSAISSHKALKNWALWHQTAGIVPQIYLEVSQRNFLQAKIHWDQDQDPSEYLSSEQMFRSRVQEPIKSVFPDFYTHFSHQNICKAG